MKTVHVALAMLLFSGCAVPGEDALDRPRAAAPLSAADTTLLATTTSMMHSGSGSVTAVPEHNISAPASCVLYREWVSHRGDSCKIEAGGDSHVPAPWHVEARFAGSGYRIDDPRRWSEKSIQAYDDVGDVMATWNGSHDYHAKHRRAIE